MKINDWMKDYATKNGHTYLDYFNHLSDSRKGMKKIYANDGVHPTDAGYKVMEPLVLKAIEKSLNE